jgi:hypothetical protein
MAHGKELRMRKQRTAPLAVPLTRGRVAVVDGYGVRLFVRRRQLVIDDGLGRDRRQRVYARATHGLSRVVVIGHEGFVTLEAIRWLTDLGIPLLRIDRDGASSPPPQPVPPTPGFTDFRHSHPSTAAVSKSHDASSASKFPAKYACFENSSRRKKR